MPAAPRPGWGPGPPRRRIEITPAIYFLQNYNCDRKVGCMLVGIRVFSPVACPSTVVRFVSITFGYDSYCWFAFGDYFLIVVVAWFCDAFVFMFRFGLNCVVVVVVVVVVVRLVHVTMLAGVVGWGFWVLALCCIDGFGLEVALGF